MGGREKHVFTFSVPKFSNTLFSLLYTMFSATILLSLFFFSKTGFQLGIYNVPLVGAPRVIFYTFIVPLRQPLVFSVKRLEKSEIFSYFSLGNDNGQRWQNVNSFLYAMTVSLTSIKWIPFFINASHF